MADVIPVDAISEAENKHSDNPEARNSGQKQKRDYSNLEDKSSQNFIEKKPASGGQQEIQVFFALSIAPETVIGVKNKLEQHGAGI
jgi:hypothetical protein